MAKALAWNEGMVATYESITLLTISALLKRKLEEYGFYNIGQLCHCTESKLKRLAGIGAKSVRDIREALAKKDLCFRPEEPQPLVRTPVVGPAKPRLPVKKKPVEERLKLLAEAQYVLTGEFITLHYVCDGPGYYKTMRVTRDGHLVQIVFDESVDKCLLETEDIVFRAAVTRAHEIKEYEPLFKYALENVNRRKRD